MGFIINPCNISGTINLDDTLAIVKHEFKRGVTVVRDYGDVGEVACYPARLNQVVLNLIMNGIQAIEGEGTVTVRSRREASSLIVQIIDTGGGIPKQHVDKIFDPGFTTKGVGVGTGLGLSICYRIVQDHLGSLEVDSEVGRGTTMTVRIPTDLDQRLSNND